MSTIKVNSIKNTSTSDGGISIDGSGHVTVDGQKLPSAGPLSNRNLIINGAMQVAQRGTSSASVTDSIVYRTVDRYIFAANGAGPVFTESQSTTAPAGFANSLKIDCTTADTSLDADAYINVTQRFEGFDCQALKKGTADAQSVTASFWVRSSKTGTYSVELFDSDNTRQITATYTISAADTWEYKTITFPGDTNGTLGNDNGNSLSISFWLGAGTDFTSGTYTNNTWAANTNANRISTSQVNLADSTSNEWYITGVQLEVGSVATPFEHRSYGDELARCQRYCHKWGGDNSASSQYARFPMAVWGSSSQITVPFPHPVPMRSCTKSLSSSIATVNVYSAGTSSSSLTISLSGDAQSFDVGCVNIGGLSGGTTGTFAAARFDNDSDGYIIFDAEL